MPPLLRQALTLPPALAFGAKGGGGGDVGPNQALVFDVTVVASMPAAMSGQTLSDGFSVSSRNGESHAYFDLGVAFSTGSYGADCDLVEAHKWFNLAAVAGHDDAARARADVAEEMTAREIAEAQRRAREWLRSAARRAA